MNKIGNISILKGNSKVLIDDTWKIIEKMKIRDCDLILESNYYKIFNNVLQAINLFKDIDIICFKDKLYKDADFVQKSRIIKILILLNLPNYHFAFPKCCYKIQNIISQTYFKIIKEIIPLSIIFIIVFWNADRYSFG